MILIIDFGSQYNQLIARRVRENSVYCIIEPPSINISEIKNPRPILKLIGIFLAPIIGMVNNMADTLINISMKEYNSTVRFICNIYP